MTRFPVLARFLRREMLARAVETAGALADGTYWGVETIYDDRDFPEPWEPSGGFAGGDGD